MATRLALQLLGGFRATLGSTSLALPTRKAEALLAYLALPRGQCRRREKLAGLLWGDTGDEQARHSLRQTLSELRKALSTAKPSPLLVEGETVALRPAFVEVDAITFERLVAEGTPPALEKAAALYQGDLLDGFHVNEALFEEWLGSERVRLRETALAAMNRLLAHQLETWGADAIQTAVRLLALDPLQEAVHRALMRLYAEQGRRGAALRQYQTCVELLQRELGIEPDEETQRLYREILPRAAQAAPPPSSTAVEAEQRRLAARVRRRAAIAPEGPCVGRDEELVRLRQAADAARQRRGGIALVVGEAGIGKSRLIQELEHEAPRMGGRLLIGRAYETERIFPFRPWIDALRGEVLGTRTRILERLSPVSRTELARLFPELGGPRIPVSMDSEDYLRLFEALSELVIRLAMPRFLIVVLEDLHWADEMSVRLLAFLGRRAGASPLLLVATAREEELPDSPLLSRTVHELDRERLVTRISLARLSREETEVLTQALAPLEDEAEARGLAARIWTASAGNPLMVVELVRALRGRKELHRGGDFPLPQRIHDLIAARLERLGDRARRLIGLAAVIGSEFEFPVMERAAESGRREVTEGVEELVRRRLLHAVGERLDFTHDLIRQVAYGELLPPRRKLLHGLVAQALESRSPEGTAPSDATLAVHYREAEIWAKAIAYFRRAGRHAAARAAHRDAIACYGEALQALGRLSKTRERLELAVDLRFDLRTSLVLTGDYGRALECLREADALATELGDQRRLGKAVCYLVEHHRRVADGEGATQCAERALAIARATGDVALEIEARLYAGALYNQLGDFRRAVDLLRWCVESLSRDSSAQDPDEPVARPVFARMFLSWALAALGEISEARVHAEEAVRLAEARGRPLDLVDGYLALGVVLRRRGDYQRAIPLLERCLELCRTWRVAVRLPFAAMLLGIAYAESGRVAEGVRLLEEAAERSAGLTGGASHSNWILRLGEGYALVGRIDDAAALAARGLELAKHRGESLYQAMALRLLGDVASRRAPVDIDEAEGYYRRSIALAEEFGMRPVLAECHLGLGRLFKLRADRTKAEQELTIAIGLLRAMDMPYWVGLAEAELRELAPQ